MRGDSSLPERKSRGSRRAGQRGRQVVLRAFRRVCKCPSSCPSCLRRRPAADVVSSSSSSSSLSSRLEKRPLWGHQPRRRSRLKPGYAALRVAASPGTGSRLPGSPRARARKKPHARKPRRKACAAVFDEHFRRTGSPLVPSQGERRRRSRQDERPQDEPVPLERN